MSASETIPNLNQKPYLISYVFTATVFAFNNLKSFLS